MLHTIETKTLAAIRHIAETIGMKPTVYMELNPNIMFDPHEATSSHDFLSDDIKIAEDDPIHIYEEAAHYIHNCANPYHKHSFTITSRLVDQFFAHSLSEAFGYFASRLSGALRSESYVSDWKQDLQTQKKESEEQLAKAEEMLALIREMNPHPAEAVKIVENLKKNYSKLDSEQNVADQSDLIYKIIREFVSSDLNSDLQKPIEEAFIYGRLDSIDPRFDGWSKLYHSIGYDLGAAIFRYYQDKPANAIDMVNRILQARPTENAVVFSETYNILGKLNYIDLASF